MNHLTRLVLNKATPTPVAILHSAEPVQTRVDVPRNLDRVIRTGRYNTTAMGNLIFADGNNHHCHPAEV